MNSGMTSLSRQFMAIPTFMFREGIDAHQAVHRFATRVNNHRGGSQLGNVSISRAGNAAVDITDARHGRVKRRCFASNVPALEIHHCQPFDPSSVTLPRPCPMTLADPGSTVVRPGAVVGVSTRPRSAAGSRKYRAKPSGGLGWLGVSSRVMWSRWAGSRGMDSVYPWPWYPQTMPK